jgi:hypothetical protein
MRLPRFTWRKKDRRHNRPVDIEMPDKTQFLL